MQFLSDFSAVCRDDEVSEAVDKVLELENRGSYGDEELVEAVERVWQLEAERAATRAQFERSRPYGG